MVYGHRRFRLPFCHFSPLKYVFLQIEMQKMLLYISWMYANTMVFFSMKIFLQLETNPSSLALSVQKWHRLICNSLKTTIAESIVFGYSYVDNYPFKPSRDILGNDETFSGQNRGYFGNRKLDPRHYKAHRGQMIKGLCISFAIDGRVV